MSYNYKNRGLVGGHKDEVVSSSKKLICGRCVFIQRKNYGRNAGAVCPDEEDDKARTIKITGVLRGAGTGRIGETGKNII